MCRLIRRAYLLLGPWWHSRSSVSYVSFRDVGQVMGVGEDTYTANNLMQMRGRCLTGIDERIDTVDD